MTFIKVNLDIFLYQTPNKYRSMHLFLVYQGDIVIM